MGIIDTSQFPQVVKQAWQMRHFGEVPERPVERPADRAAERSHTKRERSAADAAGDTLQSYGNKTMGYVRTYVYIYIYVHMYILIYIYGLDVFDTYLCFSIVEIIWYYNHCVQLYKSM